MKRIIILLGLFIFSVMFVGGVLSKEEYSEENVIEVFASGTYSDTEAYISAIGRIWNEQYEVVDAEALVKKIGDELMWQDMIVSSKIVDGYVESTGVIGDGAGSIKLCQNEEGVYVLVNVNTKDLSSICSDKKRIEKVLNSYNMTPQVNVVVSGEVYGRFDEEVIDLWCEAYLRRIDADIIWENNNEEMLLFYCYTPNIKTYLNIMEKKVNVSLSVKYDKEMGVTKIILATPINNMDF